MHANKKAMPSFPKVGKVLLTATLVMALLLSTVMAAIAVVSDPVIRAKQSVPGLTAGRTMDAANPQVAMVSFTADFHPEVFRDIDRKMQFKVTATDCELLLVYGANRSGASWHNELGTLQTDDFTGNAQALQSRQIQVTDFYSTGVAPAGDNARKTIAGKVWARVTGANPSVTVTLEDTEYPSSFAAPVTFTGYTETYSIEQRDLGADVLYAICTNRNTPNERELLGLIVNKLTNTISHLCVWNAQRTEIYIFPGNSIPAAIAALLDVTGQMTIPGWKSPAGALTEVIKPSTPDTIHLNREKIDGLFDSMPLVQDSGLNFLANAAGSFSWGPGNGYLQVAPEALLNMCTVRRVSATVNLLDSAAASVPATGDGTPLLPLALLAAGSAVGLTILCRRRGKAARRG